MRRFLSDRGAEAVEFALIAPVLLLLVLGVVEFGRAYHVQSMLSAGARDGVRVMALQNDITAAEAAARAGAAPISPVTVTVDPYTCVTPLADGGVATARVTLTYDFEFLSGLLGADMTLTGKGTMRCFG